MQRPIACLNDAARHPLRRRLPPPAKMLARDDDADWKLFVLSFTAFFTCFWTLIA